MKKILKIAFLCVAIFFALGIKCYAKEPVEYKEEFFENTSSLAQNVFEDEATDDTVSEKCTFSYIVEFLFSCVGASLENNSYLYASILLICAAACIGEICISNASNKKTATVCIGIALSLILFSISKSAIDVSVEYIYDISKLSSALIPASAGILICGGAVTGAGAGAVALSTLNVVWDKLCTSVLVPVSTSMLGFSVCETLSPSFKISSISAYLKKCYLTLIGFLSTLISAVFGMQSVISASKDSLASKSLKFVISSSVPIAGSAVSSSLSTVSASLSVIKSTVGVGALLVLIGILAPAIIYIFTIRFILSVCASVCSAAGCPSSERVYRSFLSVLDMLMAVLLIVSISFIIVVAIFLKTDFPIS